MPRRGRPNQLSGRFLGENRGTVVAFGWTGSPQEVPRRSRKPGEPCTRSTTPFTRRSDLRRRPSDPGENPKLGYGITEAVRSIIGAPRPQPAVVMANAEDRGEA